MTVLISFRICRIGWIKSGDLSLDAFYLYIDFLIKVKVLRIDEPNCPVEDEYKDLLTTLYLCDCEIMK